MRNASIDPYLRTMIGFADQLANAVNADTGFPPFDLTQSEKNKVTISVATAGFAPEDLSVELDKSILTISGKKTDTPETGKFLHRGIAKRNFARRFTLADDWEVEAADYRNGILTVDLSRNEPETPEPKRIEIRTS